MMWGNWTQWSPLLQTLIKVRSYNPDRKNQRALGASSFMLCIKFVSISWTFNKAVTIVLNRISSLHIIWLSQINICVVTKQMRDKTTRKVNKWPVTKVTLRFSIKKFAGSSCKPIVCHMHVCEKAIAWRKVSCKMTCYHVSDEKTV